MTAKMPKRLIVLWLSAMVATGSHAASDELVWTHDSGEWGAWGAYALPDSDFVIFSFGCTGEPGRVSFHVELPVTGLSEGDPAWLELRRNADTVRFDGEVFFNEWVSEHQVIAHAPSDAETFDRLLPFLDTPGSLTIVAPEGAETIAVDEAAAEALAAVRRGCIGR